MTRAGTSTCRESTGTSLPSPTTGLTRPVGATPSAPAAPRSGSGTTDPPPVTAAATSRAGTVSHHPDRARRREMDTAVHRRMTATAHLPRRLSPALRPTALVTSTRQTRPLCGVPAPAAVVMHARSRRATSHPPGMADSRQLASGALLRPALAGPAAPGCDRARRRRGPAVCRLCRPSRADLAPVLPAPVHPAPSSQAGSSPGYGGPRARSLAGFRPEPTDAGLLALACCRPPLPVPRFPAHGSLRRNRCPSSGPAGSWRWAPSAPGLPVSFGP